jgi:very-short-patch-repair endonuclease
VQAGVYKLVESPTTFQQRILGACLAAGQDAFASHRAAGCLWGLPGGAEILEISVRRARNPRIANVTVHRVADLRPRDVTRIEGIPATSVARTILDFASLLDPEGLERLLDHALANRKVTVRTMNTQLRELGTRGRRGSRRLAELLMARPASARAPDSELEARLLRTLRAHGLPPPIPQHPVRLLNGRTVRVDFAYPEALLAIEADSYHHHSSLTAWSRDRIRNNELIAMGWRVLPVTFHDLRTDPTAVADQVSRSLRVRMLERKGT